MDKKDYYSYILWAWTYINGDYREWKRTIYRKNKLTEKQKERLSGSFADECSDKYNCNIALYGCNLKES